MGKTWTKNCFIVSLHPGVYIFGKIRGLCYSKTEELKGLLIVKFHGLLVFYFLSSADIWSVGCTVIEMATGKPPWSQLYQEVLTWIFLRHSNLINDWLLWFDLSLTLFTYSSSSSFQVAALFHIGTTKSHPPIPDHLSVEAKDFLLKCLQK